MQLSLWAATDDLETIRVLGCVLVSWLHSMPQSTWHRFRVSEDTRPRGLMLC